MGQAKQRVANEKKKQNEKKRKATTLIILHPHDNINLRKNKNQIYKNKMQHFHKNHTPILHIAILREDVK